MLLTQQKVYDVKDHVKRELGREEREEPLGGVHVRFQTQIQEVCVQVWNAIPATHRGRRQLWNNNIKWFLSSKSAY